MVKTVKYPRIYPCKLCGRKYAVLNSTLHVSKIYSMRFCPKCTEQILRFIAQERYRRHRERLE